MIDIAVDRLTECERVIERGLHTFVEVGAALLEIRDSRLYRNSYSTFEEYCRDRWGMRRVYANRLINASEVVSNLIPIGIKLPETESQARVLADHVPLDLQAQVWQEAVNTAPNGKITAAHVQETAERITRPENIHVSDDSYEWYTPEEYIAAARLVMGGIDLDPASCEEANRVVCADLYFTQENDGLSRNWSGCIWLNPPYNMPNVENFTGRAHVLYQNGTIEQAIILVNNSTDAAWFHALLENYPVCFTRGRVKYWGPHASQARQGQAIFYLGDNVAGFTREFSRFGVVVVRHDNQ